MITVKTNINHTLAMLAGQEKQVRYAAAVALTRTTKDVEAATYTEFRRVFDRPTPMTMKSLRTKPATKQELWARVYVKDRALGGKNPNSAAEIFSHHFTAGQRIRKQLEYVLTENGFINSSERVVPGALAKLDRYGNMSRGQIVQILSQIGVRRSGYDSTPTGSKRSRRNVAQAGRIFWSYGPAAKKRPQVDNATGITYGYAGGSASHLPRGAWVRTGRSVQPLLLVVGGTAYRRRIDFDGIARRVIAQRFNDHFVTALQMALRTAR